MISSLFKIDGKIPVVQIILDVLIGIAGTFIYIGLYKPIFLNDAAEFMNTKQIDEQQQQHVKLVNEEVEVTLVPPEELPKLQLQEIDENEGGDGEDDDGEEEFENN